MRAHRLHISCSMPEQEVPERENTETRSESTESPHDEVKHAAKKRVTETLTDENPLIFRGMD